MKDMIEQIENAKINERLILAQHLEERINKRNDIIKNNMADAYFYFKDIINSDSYTDGMKLIKLNEILIRVETRLKTLKEENNYDYDEIKHLQDKNTDSVHNR